MYESAKDTKRICHLDLAAGILMMAIDGTFNLQECLYFLVLIPAIFISQKHRTSRIEQH